MKKLLHTKIAGFSLIEALIAALVVGVGLLALAKLQGETFLGNSDSRMRSHASNLAQDKIEEFRNFANQNTYTNFANGENKTDEAVMAGSSANFHRTWLVSSCPGVNCKQITVTVSWTDSKGAPQQVVLTSYLGEADPVKSGMVLATGAGGGAGGASSSSFGSTTTTTTAAGSTTTTITDGTTTTTAQDTTTTAPATTTTVASTTTTTIGGSQTPKSFTMVAPEKCGKNNGQACTFDRGAKDGETIQIAFTDTNNKPIVSGTVSVTIPTIDIAQGQLQPAMVGGISMSDGKVSFKVRGPGCCLTGSWVGLSKTAFTILVTVNGVPFTVYMKTDG